MSAETKTPREQAEDELNALIHSKLHHGTSPQYRERRERILDLIMIALTGWQLVPMAECGELADGDYVTRDEGETELNVKLLRNGRWYGANNLEAPTHIINPSFGPLPEVGR